MTEVPLPESVQRPPEPVRIFSGARTDAQGLPISPRHRMLYNLWEAQVGKDMLQIIPGGTPQEPKLSVGIQIPTEKRTEFEALRGKFERAVNEWGSDGEPKIDSIDDFINQYIPEDQTKHQR